MYSITELARLFALSRSTLLYYDRIGLLRPSARTLSNYRRYSEDDRARLEAISTYRGAGLSLDDIRALLAGTDATTEVLQRRLHGLEEEIRGLRAKQRLLVGMLQIQARGWKPAAVDKAVWVDMLRAAGMSEEAMDTWHREFERRAPEAHHAFLLSLGIPDEEVRAIRAWAGD